MSAFVEVRGLSKRYYSHGAVARSRRAVQAVSEVSFSIRRGTIFGLVGESGSGKTTVARSMLFLDPPTQGTVIVDGVDFSAADGAARRAMRRRMQIVFQDPHGALNPKLTIEHGIGEALTNRGVPRHERRERVAGLLELVGLRADHMKRHPHAFSGGQKQRIVIARALAMEPEFLVLDEPVSNLDVSIQAQIINLLLDLKAELDLTYLFISHDLNLISYLSDWIAVMKDGRIVEQGKTDTIATNPEHPYTKSLFEAAPVFIVKRRFTEAKDV